MNNYTEMISKRELEKSKAMGTISEEISKIEVETEKENSVASAALESGDIEKYTTAMIHVNYLKERKTLLEKQLSEKNAESVLTADEYRNIAQKYRGNTEKIRCEMFSQFLKDWADLQDHFNNSMAELEKKEAECRRIARYVGESAPVMTLTDGKQEFDNWIDKCNSGMELAQLKMLAKAYGAK